MKKINQKDEVFDVHVTETSVHLTQKELPKEGDVILVAGEYFVITYVEYANKIFIIKCVNEDLIKHLSTDGVDVIKATTDILNNYKECPKCTKGVSNALNVKFYDAPPVTCKKCSGQGLVLSNSMLSITSAWAEILVDGKLDTIKGESYEIEYVILDPPSGHMYGFPKLFSKEELEATTPAELFIKNGYPKSEIERFGDLFFYGASNLFTLEYEKYSNGCIKLKL